jgi:hypothetical protein
MLDRRFVIAGLLCMSSSVFAASYGCKDERGRLYISQTPCESELERKNKRKGMSSEEFNHLFKVQTSLDKSSKKNRKTYMDETGDYAVEGCFSTSRTPHDQGAAITYRGYRFLCMKHHKGTIARYNFYSTDLLKQCRVDQNNRFCKNLSSSSKQELMSQL